MKTLLRQAIDLHWHMWFNAITRQDMTTAVRELQLARALERLL